MNRRNFLKMVGTTGVLGACSQIEPPVKHLIPLVMPSEDTIPGVATWYSSVCRQCPSGCGIVVKIREGHAKKIEGNPLSPVNQGKLCAMGESALQVLYNPDRIKKPLKRVGKRGSGEWEEISWEAAFQQLASKMKDLQDAGEADRLFFISSPLKGHINTLISQFMEGFGTPHSYRYEFYDAEVLKLANEICFGTRSLPDYDIAHTDYLLSFGANFLETWLSPVAYAKAYGDFRQGAERTKRGKFIQCESRLSMTAANADEWVSIRPGSEGVLAMGIAGIILKEGGQSPGLSIAEVDAFKKMLSKFPLSEVSRLTDVSEGMIRQLARDFSKSRSSLALCGASAMAQENGLFHAVAVNILNIIVGNQNQKGGLSFYTPFEEIEEKRLDWQQLSNLPKEVEAGKLKAFFLHDVNLLFHAPTAFNLQKAFEKVPFIASFTSFIDETSAFSDLILPLHTTLESFGDYIPETDRGHQSIGFIQPVVPPLYDTLPLGDVFLKLASALGGSVSEQFPADTFKDFIEETWEEYFFLASLAGQPGFDFDFKSFWDRLLQKGGLWEEKPVKAKQVKRPKIRRISEIIKAVKPVDPLAGDAFDLQLYPSLNLYDGRGANQPWLQEAPDPMTSITWGSWIEIHPTVAGKMGIKEGDVLEVRTREGMIEAPAYLTPGIRPDTLAMPIGQGHTSYGRYAKGRGANPLAVLSPEMEPTTASLAWGVLRVSIKKTGKHVKLAKTEGSSRQVDHDLALAISGKEAERLKQEAPLKVIEALPNRAGVTIPGITGALAKLLRPELHNKEEDYRWGMVIDLDRCTGCGVCNVACHAENNIAIVGESEVRNQREMNWIRVERTWTEKKSTSQQALFLPMLCQQCGNAPCEPVCPVYATHHTPDGLNAQVYNRCVGTRYCAVNCPYKVRYFNWKEPEWPKPLDLQLSPDLSVREAGVMEKCTFCVQRIRTGKEDAKIEGRKVRDGEIQPACVASCPAEAMQFGNLLDHESSVSKASRDPRRYRALEHLNTQSAVVYLKRVIDSM